MRRLTASVLLLLIGGVVGAVAVAPSASAAPTVTGEFSGQCTLKGEVVPYTEFRGGGTCSGVLNNAPVANITVKVYAWARGSVELGPILQHGSGSITFSDAADTSIAFTFQQVGSVLQIRGKEAGEAVGEVALLPPKEGSTTRRAVVSANTITGLVG